MPTGICKLSPMMWLFTLLLMNNLALVHSAEGYSSFGKEFFIGAARNFEGSTQYLNVIVSTTSTTPVPFVVETSSGIVHNGSITFNNPQTVNVPTNLMVLDSTYDNRQKGIHVYSVSGYPISVILLNFKQFTVGEYLAFPCNQPTQPEYEYFAVSTGTRNSAQSQILLVGCSDNTTITIIPTQTIQVPQNISDPSSTIIAITPGNSYQTTLHQMQTFLFGSAIDLSGTRILSNKPLTVISGHECANVPDNINYCEHVTVQVPPTSTWGQNFLLIPFAGRTGGQYFKAIASRSNTILNYESCNSGSRTTLTNVGDVFEFWTNSSSFCSLSANYPILLVQLSPGSGVDGTGDPTISLVPSNKQHANKLAFVTLPEEFQNQFVSIAVQIQHFDVLKIFLDGKPLNSTWSAIRGSSGSIIGYGTRHSITGGAEHTVYHEDPRAGLSVVVYGFSKDQSYTYNGGLNLAPTTNFTEPLVLQPWYGDRMGGTVVLVSGPSFSERDEIMCKFNGINEYGVVISEVYAACTSPRLPTMGRVPFQLYINNKLHEKDAIFYSVQFNNNFFINADNTDTLLYFTEDKITVTWNNESFYPPEFNVGSEDLDVEIKLYQFNLGDETTSVLETMTAPNTGKASLKIPPLTTDEENPAIPAVVEIGAKQKTDRKRNAIQLVSSVIRGGLLYLAGSAAFRGACELWSQTQGNIGNEILDRLSDYPCPPTLRQVLTDDSGFAEDRASFLSAFFHPGSAVCYRQKLGFQQTQGSGNQCCYKKDGSLNVGPPGGGTVDLYSPDMNFLNHLLYDVGPFLLCCKGLFSNCEEYYKHRPSDDGSRFMPDPPAIVFGDPHLVTLDLFKYTFNGKGEFILIEAVDRSFTVQGRMVEATGNDSNPVSATVFSAIAAKQSTSDTVQFQLSTFKGIITLINGEEVDLSVLKTQQFNNVSVSDLDDSVLTASFANGAFMRIKEENGIISVLIVSLPSVFKGNTRGLMGNFNGDQSDDLKPRNGPTIPLSSSLEAIHNNFGLTWIIDSPQDSIFFYENGQDWSSFYSPNFSPVFEPTFASVGLEEQAKELCKNDTFCLFDVAATGRVEIGRSTLEGSINFELLVNLSKPVVCEPACKNGACVADNVCSCSEGYDGLQCDQIVYQDCDENPCLNGGECRLHAGSYTCSCSEPFSGYFCQDEAQSIAGVLAGVIVSIIVLILLIPVVLAICFVCIRKNKYKF